MLCKECAFPNEPTQIYCKKCGHPIQSVESAEKTRQDWEKLPEHARKEFQQKYQKDQASSERHKVFLENNIRKHIIIAGVINIIVGLIVYVKDTPGIWFFVYFLLTAITGCLAGWLLNKRGGGALSGAFLIWGAYVIPITIQMIHINCLIGGDMRSGGLAFGLFLFPTLYGSIFTVGTGYFFGMQLDFDRFNRGL